jgi:hypothetical protein
MRENLNVNCYPEMYEASEIKLHMDIAFMDQAGNTAMTPNLKVVAGSAGTWIIKVTNQEGDIPAGSIFHLISLNYQFAYKLQHEHKRRRDFASFEKESKAEFEFSAIGGSKRQLCAVKVRSGVFRVGESFTIRIGDRRFGSVGSEVYWTSGEAALLLAINYSGGETFKGVRGNPHMFEVVAQPEPRLIRLLGPTVAVPGQSFRMSLGIFDRNGNVIEDFTGVITIDRGQEWGGLPENVEIKREDKGIHIFRDVSIDSPGVYRLKVSTENGLESISNPIIVERRPRTFIYWGDIHCHAWGDSTMYLMHLRTAKMDPYSRHLQARDIGRLDFAAPGPMSFPRTNRKEIWSAYCEAVQQLDAPGEYVPLLS